MNAQELNSLLAAMYPSMPRSNTKAALRLQLTGDEGQVTFSLFDDTILAWRAYVAEHDPHGEWRRPPRLSTSVASSLGGSAKRSGRLAQRAVVVANRTVGRTSAPEEESRPASSSV